MRRSELVSLAPIVLGHRLPPRTVLVLGLLAPSRPIDPQRVRRCVVHQGAQRQGHQLDKGTQRDCKRGQKHYPMGHLQTIRGRLRGPQAVG